MWAEMPKNVVYTKKQMYTMHSEMHEKEGICMKWFVGVDGGGSKTDIAVSGIDGVPIVTLRRTGCSYMEIGVDNAVELVAEGVRECIAAAGVAKENCAGACIGMPCYGESAEGDRALTKALQAALGTMPIHIVNDVEVGWAGALDCCEGIHLVAGTGAIAFGRGADKKTARCGGWNEFFGDEGSCYWVGRKAMSLFTKQADGRVPRGALYELIRSEWKLADDYDFIEVVKRDWIPHREKVAAFQIFAQRAADAGDAAAAALYKEAAQQLAQTVAGLKKQLKLSHGTVNVSCAGGLFKAGALILQPLEHELAALGCALQMPKRSAVEGALILAIEQF